jgi:flagellar assembly protein FliH
MGKLSSVEKVERNLLYKDQDAAKDIFPYEMPLFEKKDSKTPDLEDGLAFHQSIETTEREAYEKGFEAGEKAGFSLGEQKALVLIERLEAIVRELTSLKETLTKELEPQILELVFSIARQIIRKELTMNPDEIVMMTKEALTRMGKTGQIIIKINPSLSDLFMKYKPEIIETYPDVIFEIDPSASQDGSVVIGPTEDIITDVDEQLRNLARELGGKLVHD